MIRFATLPAAFLATAVTTALTTAAPAQARVTLPVMDGPTLTAVCDRALALGRARADALANLPMDAVSVDTVLATWDRTSAAVEDALGPVYILTYVSPDKAVRDAGEACIVEYTRFSTQLFQNPALYERVQAVQTDDPMDAKLRRDLIEDFADAGVALPADQRTRAAEILSAITEASQAFERNIREDDATLTFEPDQLAGLPAAYLQRQGVKPGEPLTVGFDYPDYVPFMRNAASDSARQRYYRAFNRRGGQQNLELLNRIVSLRDEYAALYDMDSFAAFTLQRRMAGDVATVDEFLEAVHTVAREAEADDLAQLRALKAEQTGQPMDAVTIQQWDRSYYIERLRQATAQVDQEALREYFPTLAVRDWILAVAERLYGIRFAPVDAPTWHEDVTVFDVFDADSGERLSAIYLDLYPRPGKYKHAAAFPVRSASSRLGRKPISVLVTNFDRQGLTQGEVETFFHEFGHGLHGVLSSTRYVEHSGTSVERDFVEAPSQMFEEWARRPESLALLASVCDTCKPLDADIIARLDTARRVARGMTYARQHLYANFDFTLYSNPPQPAQPLWQQLTAATPYGYAEGTLFPATFTHIAGSYAAGYYGYMWSEAIGLDMLSAFGDDLLNARVGNRLRRTVLSQGGQEPASRMIRRFLGRAPSNDTFFQEIRGQRSALPDPARSAR